MAYFYRTWVWSPPKTLVKIIGTIHLNVIVTMEEIEYLDHFFKLQMYTRVPRF